MADLITMPKLGFDMADGILIRWVKAEGEPIKKGELIAEIETDKATVEIESSFEGIVRKHLVEINAIVPVNDAIAVIGKADEEINYDELDSEMSPDNELKSEEIDITNHEKLSTNDNAVKLPKDSSQYPAGVKVSPLARKMAKDKAINLSLVKGTGPAGRIVKKDIEGFNPSAAEQPISESKTTPATSFELTPLSTNQLGEVPLDKTINISRLRQIIGKRMVQSKMEQPSFYVTKEVDVAELMKIRKDSNNILLSSGEKISVNDFIVKATSLALRKFPNLNATIKDNKVIQFGHINVGIAVSVENGLLTVVIPDSDQKSLRQISQEVKEKATRVRNGKVSPDDISGSTFSISNLGMFDVHNFVAIINPPEAAILAIGSAYQTPVVKDNEIVPGWHMQISISVDHRVSDGAEAAQFLQTLAYYLENPLSLMI